MESKKHNPKSIIRTVDALRQLKEFMGVEHMPYSKIKQFIFKNCNIPYDSRMKKGFIEAKILKRDEQNLLTWGLGHVTATMAKDYLDILSPESIAKTVKEPTVEIPTEAVVANDIVVVPKIPKRKKSQESTNIIKQQPKKIKRRGFKLFGKSIWESYSEE